jgi:hypothetical protein
MPITEGRNELGQFTKGYRSPYGFKKGHPYGRRFQKGIHPATEFKKGNKPSHPFQKGNKPSHPFQKGHPYGCRFQKGHKPTNGFQKGHKPTNGFRKGHKFGKGSPIIHGFAKHYLYRTWLGIMHRCYDPKEITYSLYGAKGITVWEVWHNPGRFIPAVLALLGDKPSEGYSIDRINPHGDYVEYNVRWADEKTQKRNTRKKVAPFYIQ